MNPVFLSAGIGHWYPAGTDRLRASLVAQGWPWDIKIWRDEWPHGDFPRESVYTCKAAAFQRAIELGYETIIWGDASITAVRSLDKFVDVINAKGYWIGQSGYNCAQVCSDRMLAYFGVDRNDAEKMHDTATGLFGVNLKNAVVRELILTWIQAGRDGAFRGSRNHAGQSRDPRFMFGRQDQAAMSVIAGKLGVRLDNFLTHCKFAWDIDAGQEFHCQGM